MAKNNILSYGKTGLKLLALSIVNLILYYVISVPAVVIAAAVGTTVLAATLVLLVPTLIIVNGYVARKLFKWR